MGGGAVSVTLILGGARSGKSARSLALAARMAARRGVRPVYLATAPRIAGDEEWAARIDRHRADRAQGGDWRLIEEELEVCDQLAALTGGVVLIDCLTLWLANLLHAGRDADAEGARLCAALAAWKDARAGEVVLVSNEVGMGLVPESAAGRAFRDAQGRLNQQVAARACRVEFVAAGLPLVLKEERT